MLIHNADITGSLTINGIPFNSGSFSGSFQGDGSQLTGITGATTASYVEYSNVGNKPALVSGSEQISFNGIVDKPTLVSGSAQITYSGLSNIPVGIVSGSSQVSFTGIVDKPTLVSGSSQISFTGITDKPTLVSGSAQISYPDLSNIPNGIVSSSTQITGYNIFATTGSNTFNGAQTITGSIFGTGNLTIDGCITATGQIVAQTINVQQVTSSIVYSCGNNIFGTDISNTQQFTGSMFATGSLRLTGPMIGSSTACFGGNVCAPNVNITNCLGVGVTTPQGNFEVSGLSYFTRTNNSLLINPNYGGANTHVQLQVVCNMGLAFATNGDCERMRVTEGGNVGINTTNPQAGLQIEKYGSKFDGDVQYNQPAGNVFLSVTGAVPDQVNWFGMRGNYNSSTGSTNLLLQANYRDVNSQAGHYISSKATALGVADFIIGKLVTSTSVSTPPTLVSQFLITSTGIACFACQVCAPAAIFTGCVGIGTTTPQSTLHLCTVNTTAAIRIESACDQAGVRLIAGVPGTARASRIDFLNGATCVGRPQWTIINDYSQNGTNALSFVNCDPGTRVVDILQNGNVGIGVPSPCYKLDVRNASGVGAQTIVSVVNKTNDSNTGAFIGFGDAYTDTVSPYLFAARVGGTREGSGDGGFMSFYTRPTSGFEYERMRITAGGIACFACQICAPSAIFTGGNVGIGTTNPQIYGGYVTLTIGENVSNRVGLLKFRSTYNSGDGAEIYQNLSGTLLFNINSSTTPLIVESGLLASNGAGCFKSRGDARVLYLRQTTTNSDNIIQFLDASGTNIWEVVGRNNEFYIYNAAVSNYSMCINPATNAVHFPGAVSKGSGTFNIEHPLDSKKCTHRLVHSFIEGPNADLIYSGHATLINGISCINIDCASRMTEGTFLALNRCLRVFTTNETSWDAVKGRMVGNTLVIQSQNENSTDNISWMVIGERQDEHMVNGSITDSNGRIIVEPEIEEQFTCICAQ
jgi:hypothetical protein